MRKIQPTQSTWRNLPPVRLDVEDLRLIDDQLRALLPESVPTYRMGDFVADDLDDLVASLDSRKRLRHLKIRSEGEFSISVDIELSPTRCRVSWFAGPRPDAVLEVLGARTPVWSKPVPLAVGVVALFALYVALFAFTVALDVWWGVAILLALIFLIGHGNRPVIGGGVVSMASPKDASWIEKHRESVTVGLVSALLGGLATKFLGL